MNQTQIDKLQVQRYWSAVSVLTVGVNKSRKSPSFRKTRICSCWRNNLIFWELRLFALWSRVRREDRARSDVCVFSVKPVLPWWRPPLARWSSSLGHCPPSHQRLFRISSLLLSCSWRIPRVISSLNGEPEEKEEEQSHSSSSSQTC